MSLKWPAVHSETYFTPKRVEFLRRPGVALIGQTAANIEEISPFLFGYDPALEFRPYTEDPVALADAEQLCKTAGQLCYMSFGPKRTWNKDAETYFRNIKESGHGSVLEHANFSFLCYGIDRSVTHELVRHRAGFGFSQVSQRFVDGSVLRFVERAEYQSDTALHERFMHWIEAAVEEYDARAERLLELQHGASAAIMTAETKRDARKKVNQAARAALPNEAEAPIVVTANVRGWRHFCEMRANAHAEVAIRALAMRIYECLHRAAPLLFSDYEVENLPDGTQGVSTKNRKV